MFAIRALAIHALSRRDLLDRRHSAGASIAEHQPSGRHSGRRRWPALVVGLLLSLLGSSQAGVEAEENPADQARPVATVGEIMGIMVIPTSAALWNVASAEPETDEAWRELERASVLLAEAGNLLLTPGRVIDDDIWRQTSRMMVDEGAKALEAARARDVQALIDSGNAVVDACEICHESHLSR